MKLLRSIATVVRFEGRRSVRLPRLVWWALLVLFPPALMGLVRVNEGLPPPDEIEAVPIVVYVLCPGVVSMLGVLLWAAPAVSSELEGRSWVYPAVRPRGALAVYLGKYLVAVAWTVPAGLISAAAALRIMAPHNWLELLGVQSSLVTLSCLAYGAAYSLIGVLVPKRAMVTCVFYTVTLEVILVWVPAAVNLLTIQFRLRCLLVRWMGWDATIVKGNPVFEAYFGDESASWHLAVLLAMTAGMLTAASLVLRWREFTAEAETDV
jgi:hypothetical protein